MPELYQATVPMWDKHLNKRIWGDLFIMLPHELLPMLARDNVEVWTKFDDSVRELENPVGK